MARTGREPQLLTLYLEPSIHNLQYACLVASLQYGQETHDLSGSRVDIQISPGCVPYDDMRYTRTSNAGRSLVEPRSRSNFGCRTSPVEVRRSKFRSNSDRPSVEMTRPLVSYHIQSTPPLAPTSQAQGPTVVARDGYCMHSRRSASYSSLCCRSHCAESRQTLSAAMSPRLKAVAFIISHESTRQRHFIDC